MGATQEVYCDLEEIQDEELVSQARDGSEVALEALINKYKNFVRAKARSYFLVGAIGKILFRKE